MTEEEKKEFIRLLDMICPHIKSDDYKSIKFPDEDGIVDHIIQIELLDAEYVRITHILSSPPAFGRGFSEICVYRPFWKHEQKLIFFNDWNNVPRYVMFSKYSEFDTKKLFTQLNMMIVKLI